MIEVTFPDGSTSEYSSGVTVLEVVRSIGPGLAKDALVAELNGEPVDLSFEISEDSTLNVITEDSEEAVPYIRHSTSHIMAMAVQRIFPETSMGMGPATDDGFYYDFRKSEPFVPEDLERIEAKMREIIGEDLSFERIEMPVEEAVELFEKREEDLKVELIKERAEDSAVVYKTGDWMDFCRGPHVPSTGRLGAFKLMKIAGAYWKGKESNEMLQRIYGTAFGAEKELKRYIEKREKAKERDHRKLGEQLDLFSFHSEGPGFPFWHENGMVLFNQVVDYWREEHRRSGYREIKTPMMLREELWHRSGHWDNYKDNMYFSEIDDEKYAIKPMNCPGGLLVYKENHHSYRDLPVRMTEIGEVHRHELSGVLSGLFRVRSFHIDDAHIFCTPDQMEEELTGVIDLILKVYETFGFEDVDVELSTQPEKSLGGEKIWEESIAGLENALDKLSMDYDINEGDGAFYGPKIDFHITDCLDRKWQCGTVQLDFSLPERFDLEYVGADDNRHTPILIHRALLGSLERFIGILIEHYGGDFPLWMSPEQIRILPITDEHMDYARKIEDRVEESGLRVQVDERSEKMGYKIREAELDKIPVMFVVGDRERENETVSVRTRNQGDVGERDVKDILEKLKKISVERVIEFEL